MNIQNIQKLVAKMNATCIVCNSPNAQLVYCCDDCIDNAMKMHSAESDFVDNDE